MEHCCAVCDWCMSLSVPKPCPCCFVPPASRSPTQVSVTCQRPTAGWPGFSVTLTAMDKAGCMANVTNATTFAVQQKPVVAINGAITATTCTNAANITLSYKVDSSVPNVLTVGVSTNTAQVICSLRSNGGEFARSLPARQMPKLQLQVTYVCCSHTLQAPADSELIVAATAGVLPCGP